MMAILPAIHWLLSFLILINCRSASTNDPEKSPPVAVIGAGYSGLSAALELRLLGYDVVMYERSSHVGGRAYKWSEAGFTFDAGPSWYWMPHVFEDILAKFGRHSKEFYNLTRLDPAYAVYFGHNDRVDVPGDIDGLKMYIKSIEPEAEACVEKFFSDGKRLYEKGVDEWIWKPMVSLSEFMDVSLIRAALEMNMFGSLEAEIEHCVKNERLRTILKWPVIFLGARPKDAPAMYSLMSYAGHADGTWYPTGGMSAPAEALAQTAREAGVTIKLAAEVEKLDIEDKHVRAVCTKYGGCQDVQGVVASGDYHHMEQVLLPKHLRRYDETYWDNQVLSPSVLLYYVGLKRLLPLQHHTFFFDAKLDESLHAAIDEHRMEQDPVFYVTSTSQVDPATAPKGGSSLFILVPISYKLNGTDSQKVRDSIFQSIIRRMEQELGTFKDDIAFFRDYGPSDFEKEFFSFRGNAFGHANLLSQSLILKPSMDSLLDNFVFAGHLTNPGPGIPPALASGATAARLLQTKLAPSFFSCQRLLIACCIVMLFWRFSLRTELQRSRRECMRLIYNHGRTFFAGASLMAPQQFFDTAAIYGLMRIADDCVDDVDDFAERKRRIDEFEGIFWRCWHAQTAHESDHPVMPAVIETCLRLKYPRSFFDRFFAAMRSDTEVNICRTWEDCERYIDGSAAVVGEFMLPILMPHSTQEEIDEARPHAMDLGRAFQLTNFSRDVDEDLDIQRQYVPVELCEKHGVDLSKRTSQQEGFSDMIEEMYQRCDAYYKSADKGIAILPERVRPVVLVAAKLYHAIQNEVRVRGYGIFEERVRVPTKKKLKYASEYIGLHLTMKMVAAELFLLVVFSIDRMSVPFCLLVAAWQFCEHFSWAGLTYAGFHVIFTLPAMALMIFFARQSSPTPEYFKIGCNCIGLLCIVATLWTSPWDNYLVRSGVWDYPDGGHVLGVIGYVPIEEYAFFSIETIFVGMLWLWQGQVKIIPHFRTGSPWRILGLAGFAILFALSLLMLTIDRTFYLGLIIAWSTPILALQWAFGAHALMAQRDVWIPPLIYSWIYLCIVDRWAIKNGCWNIKMETSLPRIDYLPVEEAYFFLVTSTMCIWGLQLAMNVCTLDCGFSCAVQRVMSWARKVETPQAFQWTAVRLHLLFLSLLVGTSLLFMRNLTHQTQVILMIVPSLMVGLPFGKVSMVVADWLQIKGPSLCLGYAGAAALVVSGWYIFPTVAFLVTTGVAMAHFGHAETKGTPGNIPGVDFVARGGMMLLAVRYQPEAVSWIVAQLVPEAQVTEMAILSSFTGLHLACLVASIVIHMLKCHKSHHMETLIGQLLLTVTFLCLPPLLSFTIYFNASYTPHVLLRASQLSAVRSSLAKFRNQKGGVMASTVAFLAFAVVSLVLFFCLSADDTPMKGHQSNGIFPGALLKVAFVILSAVSTPNMFLMSMRLNKSSISETVGKDDSSERMIAISV
jgi:phytoene desaturase